MNTFFKILLGCVAYSHIFMFAMYPLHDAIMNNDMWLVRAMLLLTDATWPKHIEDIKRVRT